jgi:dephospho-CoA kinase
MLAMVMAVTFAGKIGSGKTTITKSLAKTLGWPRVGFGEYVRSVARERGEPQTRKHLQELGTRLLADDPHQFCKAVLLSAEWRRGESLIIDGLRHVETIEIIREFVSPAILRIVLLSVPEQARIRRLKERGEGDALTIVEVEAHSSEQQVASGLSAFADLSIDGDKKNDAVVSEIAAWIRNQQCN